MTALKGPVSRLRDEVDGCEDVPVVVDCAGVEGRDALDGDDMRFASPPSRSVAPAEAWTCEPAISLRVTSVSWSCMTS